MWTGTPLRRRRGSGRPLHIVGDVGIVVEADEPVPENGLVGDNRGKSNENGRKNALQADGTRHAQFFRMPPGPTRDRTVARRNSFFVSAVGRLTLYCRAFVVRVISASR
jgi:hypothetical protein